MDNEDILYLACYEGALQPKGRFIRFGRRRQAQHCGIVKKSIITATKLAHLSDDYCVCVEGDVLPNISG